MSSWAKIQRVRETGSTNADLAAAARAGAPHGTVLVADFQSAGRGRFDRVWEAPPGASIAVSAILRPPDSVSWSWMPLLVGLAVSDALLDLGADVSLKWPNDVLLVGGGAAGGGGGGAAGKVCGILCERVETKYGLAGIAGFGINVSLTEDQLPVPTATSLSLAGIEADAYDVAQAAVAALGSRFSQWVSGADLRGDYIGRCSTLGRQVRVLVSPTEAVTGMAVGISRDGCLLVEVDGEVHEFTSGDVFHLR